MIRETIVGAVETVVAVVFYGTISRDCCICLV